MKINLCLRCNHQWPSKLDRAITCAKCRSPYWDIAKGTTATLAAPEEAPEEIPEEEPQVPERFNMYYKIQERIDPEKADADRKALIESLKHLTIPGNKPTDSVLPTYAKVETDDVTIDYGEI